MVRFTVPEYAYICLVLQPFAYFWRFFLLVHIAMACIEQGEFQSKRSTPNALPEQAMKFFALFSLLIPAIAVL